jgi:uncharacterized membrane protein YjjP (DUF1212 family)
MDFKINWKSPVLPRILLLAVSIFFFCLLLFEGEWFASIILFLASVYQIKLLLEFLEKSNQNVASFFYYVSFDDLYYSFKTDSNDPNVQRIHKELNEAMSNLRNSRRE